MSRTKGSVGKDHRGYVGPWAPEYMVQLEQRYNTLRAERLMIEGAMRRDPDRNQRGTAYSIGTGVTATRVLASDRPHIGDSFDARAAKDRSWERPYSERRFLDDVKRGRSPRRRCGACYSLRVPAWFIAALDGLDYNTRTVALEPFSRDEFVPPRDETRKTRKAVSVAESRRVRRMEIATPADFKSIDWTQV